MSDVDINKNFKGYFEHKYGFTPSYGMMIADADAELEYKAVMDLVQKHSDKYAPRYAILKKVYEEEVSIFAQDKKSDGKPDNRIAVNFPKYCTQTFNGYFVGIPIKVSHKDDEKNAYIQRLIIDNDQEDNDSELSKMCDQFGIAVEMLYQDENGMPGMVPLSPTEAFVVYDDTVLHNPMWGIRYNKDDEGITRGSVSTDTEIYWFSDEDGVKDFHGKDTHAFGGVPMIEYRENDEYRGLYEDSLSMVDAFNKAFSEKANDVDYFGDAYIKILGAMLDENDLKKLRENRIINLENDNGVADLIVEFMGKPDADVTQENLLNRLHTLMFTISMVADVSDENFVGNSSGVALKYKLLGMSNLAVSKERKFKGAMRRKWAMICGYPQGSLDSDDIYDIDFTFSRNLPVDLDNEAEAAGKLMGIVSHSTVLDNLSIVNNANEELEQIADEKATSMVVMTDSYSVERAGEGSDGGEE